MGRCSCSQSERREGGPRARSAASVVESRTAQRDEGVAWAGSERGGAGLGARTGQDRVQGRGRGGACSHAGSSRRPRSDVRRRAEAAGSAPRAGRQGRCGREAQAGGACALAEAGWLEVSARGEDGSLEVGALLGSEVGRFLGGGGAVAGT